MGDKLNAGAKEWKPSATAAEWKPSWLPAEAAAPEPVAQEVKPPEAEQQAEEEVEVEVDELAEQLEAVAVLKEEEEVAVEEEVEEELPAPAADEKKVLKDDSAAKSQAASEPEPVAPAPPKPVAVVDPSQFEKEKAAMLESVQDADPREHLNVVFIGHVDAGKSTLSGSILYLMGTVDKRTIEKFEQEAKERNRESWFLAYIMDTNEEERAKGKTVEVGRAYFESEARRVTILDAPGHKNYVPAMISGASQADVGILVISARKGEFEAGFEGLGQTREHAMLAKTLGIQKLIVVINKMDEQTVKWSQARYDLCVKKLRPFLKGCGFKVKKDVIFLPISALNGANVKELVKKEVCPWAVEASNGKSLLNILDTLNIQGRDSEKPLRMTIIDRYVERGVVIMGKVESGCLYVGQTVSVCPNQQEFRVDAIYINEQEVKGARPGENVLVRLNGINENEVAKGHVICSRFYPIAGSTEIIAQLFIVGLLEHRPLMSAGYNAVFHAHTSEEECTVYEITAELDKVGKIAKNKPAFAKSGVSIICKIRLEKSVVLEPYEKTMQLGRFTLRDEGKSIAIGVVKRCR